MTAPTRRLNLSHLIWILLLCPLARLQTNDSAKEGEEELLPFFDPASNMTTNLTVQMGSDVFLSCPVQQLGQYKVSWLKKDDKGILQLLTYGKTTYSSDTRQSPHFVKPNDWQLRLTSVQRLDGGNYQCQMSTHPPKILHYTLNVIAPTVDIVDDGEKPLKDKIFKTGSTLELRCIVNQVGPTMDSSQHVSWYHGNRLLNNDTFRGGISVKSWVQKESGFSKLSKLYVANVNSNDSGWYTCSMGRFGNATVYVSILNGETPAAMQHGKGSQIVPLSSLILFVVSVTTVAFYIIVY